MISLNDKQIIITFYKDIKSPKRKFHKKILCKIYKFFKKQHSKCCS
jgi:hypothetical protein